VAAVTAGEGTHCPHVRRQDPAPPG
jgi:hypothetical protein